MSALNRKIHIFTNETEISRRMKVLLKRRMIEEGFTVSEAFSGDEELIVSIGGDGAFLRALHSFDLPDIPFIGINTGHLGFFQEILPEQVDDFIDGYKRDKFKIQLLDTVCAVVQSDSGESEFVALNEIVIRGALSRIIHLIISIDGSYIERFSGDGIIVSTPAGSTAYSYSLGGAIVDPRLSLLQLTPMAPMNTTAYRSFTSGILLPSDLSIGIQPEKEGEYGLNVSADGFEHKHTGIKNIEICKGGKTVKLLRFENYDFWNKVKTKFL